MKKKTKIFATLLLTLGVAGCSCSNTNVEIKLEKDENIAEVNGEAVLTKQGIYDYVKNTAPEAINKAFLSKLIDKILHEGSSYTKETYNDTFNYKLKKYFTDNFIENDEYKIKGKFNEELLVADLRNKMYKINDPKAGLEGVTYELGLKYDYSEYIANALTYDIHMEMLKEDYMLNARKNILDKSQSRIITVYKTDKVEDMEKIVADLFNGKYESLDDIVTLKKNEEKEEIERQYCENLGLGSKEEFEFYKPDNCMPTKSNYDRSYDKFTTCEFGKRCTTKEGLAYQKKLIDDTIYIKEEVVNKYSEDVLYEDAFNHLIRSDIDNLLLSDEQMKQIFKNNGSSKGRFLINGLYNDESDFNNKDIILSKEPGSACYIVLVRPVNSSTGSKIDKETVMAPLLGKVNEASVLLNYIKNMKIELIDKELIDNYSDLIK